MSRSFHFVSAEPPIRVSSPPPCARDTELAFYRSFSRHLNLKRKKINKRIPDKQVCVCARSRLCALLEPWKRRSHVRESWLLFRMHKCSRDASNGAGENVIQYHSSQSACIIRNGSLIISPTGLICDGYVRAGSPSSFFRHGSRSERVNSERNISAGSNIGGGRDFEWFFFILSWPL